MVDFATGAGQAQEYREKLAAFVGPLLSRLDQDIDKRLVRTFLKTLEAIITFRHSSQGLLLSELGAYILSPAQAPAGTKRLSNLLRSEKWSYELVEDYLWGHAQERLAALRQKQEEALLVWDESVWEKAESIALEGLCAVRSSVAPRLKRIKPGFYNPPGGRPVFVPGLNWLSVLLLSYRGAPTVVAMQWWTNRGEFATDRRAQQLALLVRLAQAFGRSVLHIWDRGFAGAPWLGAALQQQVRFVTRWPKAYHLLSEQGQLMAAWKLSRAKRSWQQRTIYDAPRRQYRTLGFLALPCAHPEYPDQPLWLVVSRPGHGRPPWYLLTNEPIFTTDDAWRVVLAYTRRWQIEMAYRFTKSELALESPRLWRWHNRLKLLMMTTLVYAFLLSLLDPTLTDLRQALLRYFCHRTGKRGQVASAPLYRLRSALSRLWLAFQSPYFQNSG